MKRVWLAGVLLSLVALALAPAAQGRLVIRMATLVPGGSIWDRNLKQMAADWSKASGGRVTLTVFPGGSLGDEREVVRRMRFENPQAAALTVVGLAEIDPAFNVFTSPFFFDSYDELYHVIEKLTPTLAARLDERNLVLLAWGHGGWAQVFTTRPVRTLAELKGIKLFTSAGDERMVQWYKANGFQPVALAMTDILTSLTSGMIEGLPAPPAAANAFQWFRQTKFMLDIGIAPVVGAVVITRPTWNKLPEADRAAFLAAARAMEQRLETEIPNQDKASIAEMQKRGLTVVKTEGPEWRTIAQQFSASMGDSMVPADIRAMALRERDAYRTQKPAGSGR
jgi:TRAP-type C4-dicarboxylate transport system substrate-binding protein